MNDDDEGAMPWNFWAFLLALCALLALLGGLCWDIVQALFFA